VDFGGSGAKSGIAQIDEHGMLTGLRVRPAVDLRGLTDDDHVEELAATMVRIIGDVALAAQAAQAAQIVSAVRAAGHIACSVAAYVQDGQPVPQRRGPYAQLHRVAGANDVAGWLARRVSDRVSQPVGVSFHHDGTAAGAALAGVPPPGCSAVVMLGTALGVGFVPDGAGVRPIGRRFSVHGSDTI
jgi:hypothetical protein